MNYFMFYVKKKNNKYTISETRGKMQGWKDKTILEKLVRKKGQIRFFYLL